jgi:tRNA modification GTPase
MLNLQVQAKPDTIAAIATGAGRGGIGVIRVSGTNFTPLIQSILCLIPEPRCATYTSFFDRQGAVLDQGIALYFPSPHSYTGEDVLELQGHGGLAVLQLVLQRCIELGARLAQPGEFTQRSFLNGKLDLAQAESVADLIDATTSQAARCAVRSLNGEFSLVIRQLVDALIELRMLVEAMLDFPEEDIAIDDISHRQLKLDKLISQLNTVHKLGKQGSLLREGAHIVLAGQPNVGKSSLLNRLSGEEVALVSASPGTTRDVIRQAIQINGIPLHIIDTAGLRDSQDEVEIMGIERTRSTLNKADAILLLMDVNTGLSKEDKIIIDSLPNAIPKIFVFNKIDLLEQPPRLEHIGNETHVYLSAKSGLGLDLLREALLGLIGWHQESGAFMARERHLMALKEVIQLLNNAQSELHRSELLAEDLRLAQEKLNSITGEFTADDLLGEIFSRFCIGK